MKIDPGIPSKKKSVELRLTRDVGLLCDLDSQMAIDVRLGDVHKDWITHLSKTRAECRVFSPYLTSSTAEEFLQSVRRGELELYTVFSVENFAAGGSSLETLKRLLDAEIPVFHLQDLHAKIVWSGRQFLTIGSQNLTHRGTEQKEATVIIRETSIPLELTEILESWIKERQPITRGMIASVEKILPELRRKADMLREEAEDIEGALWQREKMLLEKKVRSCRSHLRKLGAAESVPFKVASEFIESTSVWIDHSSGSPVGCPNDASNIYGSDSDWCIDYGANTFMVGKAIVRCRDILKQFLSKATKGGTSDFDALRSLLTDAIRASVQNYNGDEILYPLDGEHLRFGTKGIDVEQFVKQVLSEVPVERILREE